MTAKLAALGPSIGASLGVLAAGFPAFLAGGAVLAYMGTSAAARFVAVDAALFTFALGVSMPRWITALGDRLNFGGMSRRDRQRWAAATSIQDLGELVVAWLHGEIKQTPGHCGPPCEETLPLIPALTAANRAGFITDNSQQADSDGVRSWEAWVTGFATGETLARLRAAVAGTPLILTACRRGEHDGHRNWMGRCPWREVTGFWADACPAVAVQIRACWHVAIDDPEPGRNDRLWPALERFAAQETTNG